MFYFVVYNLVLGIVYSIWPEPMSVDKNFSFYVLLAGGCVNFLDKFITKETFFVASLVLFTVVINVYTSYVSGSVSLLPNIGFPFISALFGGLLVGLLIWTVFYLMAPRRAILLATAWAVTVFVSLPLVSFVLAKIAG